jgi:hypothetical protein
MTDLSPASSEGGWGSSIDATVHDAAFGLPSEDAHSGILTNSHPEQSDAETAGPSSPVPETLDYDPLEEARRVSAAIAVAKQPGGLYLDTANTSEVGRQAAEDIRESEPCVEGSIQTTTDDGNYEDPCPPEFLGLDDQDQAPECSDAQTAQSPGPSSAAKGKQKQIVTQDATQESLEAHPHTLHSLHPGQPGWESSSGRPPVKLPIRFKDAVGRNFLFPWDKAKTWQVLLPLPFLGRVRCEMRNPVEAVGMGMTWRGRGRETKSITLTSRQGMERLIRAAFAYVHVLRPHVDRGAYDVVATQISTAELNSMISHPTTVAAALNSTQPPTASMATLGPSSSLGPTTVPAPVPLPPMGISLSSSNQSQGSSSHTTPESPDSKRAFVILPELWEDTVVPGMELSMHMWPIDNPPPAPPPPPPGQYMYTHGRGRGGPFPGYNPPPMPPPMVGTPNPWIYTPPRHRLITVEPVTPPRAKTRKKQGS